MHILERWIQQLKCIIWFNDWYSNSKCFLPYNIVFCYMLLTLQVFYFFNKTKCRFSQYCFSIVYNLISGNHILRCGKMHLKTCQHLCRFNSYTWTLDVSPRHFSSLTHLHGFIVWIILIFRINFWTTFFQFRI